MLDDVVVDPKFRGQGVGHALMAELAAWYSDDGYTEMWGLASGSVSAEGGLRGWYSRMGFRFGGTPLPSSMRASIDELAAATAHYRLAP